MSDLEVDDFPTAEEYARKLRAEIERLQALLSSEAGDQRGLQAYDDMIEAKGQSAAFEEAAKMARTIGESRGNSVVAQYIVSALLSKAKEVRGE